MLKVISPTGCVHAATDVSERGWYAVYCNHTGWRFQHYHKWVKIEAVDVSCKRCLHVMNKKIEYKETGWTRARRFCKHRYPHLKHGVLCRNKCYYGAAAAPKKCESLFCPMPDVSAPPMMVKEHVLRTIAQINKEFIHAEKTFRIRFNMIAVHCPWRKPAVLNNGHPHRCTDPLLRKRGKDEKAGWACIMQNCPHMIKAFIWRNTEE